MSLDRYVAGPSPETRVFEGLKTSEKFNAKAQQHLSTISYWSRKMTKQGFDDWIEHQSLTGEYNGISLATPEAELLQNLVFKALLEPLGKEMIVPSTTSAASEMKALLDQAEINTEAYLRAISEGLESRNFSEEEVLSHLQVLAKVLRSWLDDE